MSRYHLLDTNVYSAWIDDKNKNHAIVMEQMERLKGRVYLSAITIAETEYGLSRPHCLAEEQVRKIRSNLVKLPVLEINHHVAEPYGKLRAWLTEKYAPRNKRGKLKSLSQLTDPVTDRELGIQENDLWIASQAIATETVLVSYDAMNRIYEAANATDQKLFRADW